MFSQKEIFGDSIRVIMTRSCQERCDFCHREGGKDYKGYLVDVEEVLRFSKKVRENFGLNVVHLTGGEPTLHPQIVDLVEKLNNESFGVQMTTNGDSSPDLLKEIVWAGARSINFSLHAIRAESFQKMQITDKDSGYYRGLLERKIENIMQIRPLVKVKINTVTIDEKTTGEVVDFAIENDIPLRLMRNLNKVPESDKIIASILSQRGLQPVMEEVAIGDSGGSGIIYASVNQEFHSPSIKVKKFGEVYLSSICDDCSLKGSLKCRERFYGIRFGANPITGRNEVTLCIDKDDGTTVVSPDEIFEGGYRQSLEENYIEKKVIQ